MPLIYHIVDPYKNRGKTYCKEGIFQSESLWVVPERDFIILQPINQCVYCFMGINSKKIFSTMFEDNTSNIIQNRLLGNGLHPDLIIFFKQGFELVQELFNAYHKPFGVLIEKTRVVIGQSLFIAEKLRVEDVIILEGLGWEITDRGVIFKIPRIEN